MRIAIPVAKGLLCQHFGHCEKFMMINVEDESKAITDRQELVPPPHEPGLLPRWLHEKGATMIIAGGMGASAQKLFKQNNIEVVTGAPSADPAIVVDEYLRGTLKTGKNACDH